MHFIRMFYSLNSFIPRGYSIRNSCREQFFAVFLKTPYFFSQRKATTLCNSIKYPPWDTPKILNYSSAFTFLWFIMCSSIISFKKSLHLLFTSVQLSPFSHLYSRIDFFSLSAFYFHLPRGFPYKIPPPFYLKTLVITVGIFYRYFASLLIF